jgi:hypothetical protein
MSPFRQLLTGTCAAFALGGCDDVTSEARRASSEGRVINNSIMSQAYPASFVPGTPKYLERDFEAGANFICDEIKMKRGRDICAESDINWR